MAEREIPYTGPDPEAFAEQLGTDYAVEATAHSATHDLNLGGPEVRTISLSGRPSVLREILSERWGMTDFDIADIYQL